jgi:hypothetical protein
MLYSKEIATLLDQSTAWYEELEQFWSRHIPWLHGQPGEPPRGHSYDGYPFLFSPAYPDVALERVAALARAGRLLAVSVCLYDHVIDGGTQTPHHGIRAQAMQFEALRALGEVIPMTDRFWERLRSHFADLARACWLEAQFSTGQRQLVDLDEASARELAIGKNAVARAAIDGLAALAGARGPADELLHSVEEFYVALTILDDLADWREDLERGRPSLVLARAARDLEPAERSDQRAMASAIFVGGHATACLELAESSVRRGREAISALPAMPWRLCLDKLGKMCARLRGDLARSPRRSTAGRAPIEFQPQDLLVAEPHGNAAWRYTRQILDELAAGLRHAQWACVLPEGAPGYEADWLWQSDLMARTLVLGTLTRVGQCLDVDLQPVLAHERDTLLELRGQTDEPWRYWPGCHAVPPTVDLVAYIAMSFAEPHPSHPLARAARQDLLAFFRAAPADALGAWIQPWLRDHEAWHCRVWGRGEHVELLAPALDLARRMNAPEARAASDRIARWLDARQNPDGTWPSTWLHNAHYTTFRAVQALAGLDWARDSIDRAVHHTLQTQQTGGAWAGAESASDPLATALAVLTLAASGRNTADVELALDRASGFLLRLAHDEPRAKKLRFATLALDTGDGPVSLWPYETHLLTAAFLADAHLALRRRAADMEQP